MLFEHKMPDDLLEPATGKLGHVTRLSMGTELDSEMAVQEREIKLLLLYFEGLGKLKHLKNYD